MNEPTGDTPKPKGHDPAQASGSLKPPLYQTSTFEFRTAEEGKRFFEIVYGTGPGPEAGESVGYLYSRLDNPNLRAAEAVITGLFGAEDSLVFNSGMAAISTLFLAYLKPGDLILSSSPVYGGTAKILGGLLQGLGIRTLYYPPGESEAGLNQMLEDTEQTPSIVYVETPCNPTNEIHDIRAAASVAGSHGAKLVVDNTFLSAYGQRPLDHGADLVVESATKYLGGHSDVTAGVIAGRAVDVASLRNYRYDLGTTASPMTAWLLSRSLETYELRLQRQVTNATAVAGLLAGHDKVIRVNHLSLLEEGDPGHEIFVRQCLSPGAMVAFEVQGGEEGAFRFLNGCRIIHQATSLGGTESLASHPWTTSHLRTPEDVKREQRITPGLIRLSVGVEPIEDLLADLRGALELV